MPFQTVNVLPVLPKPQNGSGARNGPTLSSAEDKEMKKKLRNRESALAARERKKQKMLELERKVSELGRENSELKVENCALRGTLSTVMQKYGAPQNEIEDTLKTTQTLAIKKEPVESKAKNSRKAALNRLSQKVISLGPNERKPPPVNPSVAVKQETPEICENSEVCENSCESSEKNGIPTGTPTIVLPKIGSSKMGSPQKRAPKVILAQNIMFSPKKQGNFKSCETGKRQDGSQLNALDMLELPVVKQEPQEYNSKQETVPESPVSSQHMIGSPTPSPSSSDSLVAQPVSPLWSASGSPSSNSDSAYSTGSETGMMTSPSTHTGNTSQQGIQLSPLRSQTENQSKNQEIPESTQVRPQKRPYQDSNHNTVWYNQPPERQQRMNNNFYNQPTQNHTGEISYVEDTSHDQSRVPVVHSEAQEWTQILQNDIHLTSDLGQGQAGQGQLRPHNSRPDPTEYLSNPISCHSSQQYHPNSMSNPMCNRGNQGGNRAVRNDHVIDFQQQNRNQDFDSLTDRSLFQTSMLNIDEVLFGLS